MIHFWHNYIVYYIASITKYTLLMIANANVMWVIYYRYWPYASLSAGADVCPEQKQQLGDVIMALRTRFVQRRVARVVGHRWGVLEFFHAIAHDILWTEHKRKIIRPVVVKHTVNRIRERQNRLVIVNNNYNNNNNYRMYIY